MTKAQILLWLRRSHRSLAYCMWHPPICEEPDRLLSYRIQNSAWALYRSLLSMYARQVLPLRLRIPNRSWDTDRSPSSTYAPKALLPLLRTLHMSLASYMSQAASHGRVLLLWSLLRQGISLDPRRSLPSIHVPDGRYSP